MRNTKSWINFLWVLVVLLAVTRLATTAFSPSLTIPVVMAAAVFALIHGALRYRWSGIVAFLVVCLVVSNILENTSILTGFPFGHYHYTSGPMLFLVPWFIGPSYFATAYLAWMVGVVLIGDVRREVSWFTTVAVPVIGSAVMVMWDLTFDPTASTIKHFWIWEQGGGYFGVPSQTTSAGSSLCMCSFSYLLCSSGSGGPVRIHYRCPRPTTLRRWRRMP